MHARSIDRSSLRGRSSRHNPCFAGIRYKRSPNKESFCDQSRHLARDWRLIGFLGGRVLGTNRSRTALAFNVAVGMVGAFIGGILFGGSTLSSSLFSVGALLIALVGAVILSAFATFFRRDLAGKRRFGNTGICRAFALARVVLEEPNGCHDQRPQPALLRGMVRGSARCSGSSSLAGFGGAIRPR